MPIVTFSWNITRIALECTLEYYEILHSRFALERRYRRKVDEENGEKPACVVPLHDKMNVILDVPEKLVKRRNVFKIEDPIRKNSRKRKE